MRKMKAKNSQHLENLLNIIIYKYLKVFLKGNLYDLFIIKQELGNRNISCYLRQYLKYFERNNVAWAQYLGGRGREISYSRSSLTAY